jgi:dephospho-CoA kinase
MNSKLVIGLIGGIGSGKSRVAQELTKHGGYLISGDRLGHEALCRPEIREQVSRRFGKEMLDGAGNIERRRLGARVFADPAQRKALEELVFPYIERRMGEEIDRARQDRSATFIVLDAAVMLEAGWNKRCDRLVYVDAPRHLRLERLARERGLGEREVQAREDAQWPLAEKRGQADFVIDNAKDLESLAEQVQHLLEQIGIAR